MRANQTLCGFLAIAVLLFLTGCACPFHEEGQLHLKEAIPVEQLAQIVGEALAPLKFTGGPCKSFGDTPKRCDYEYTVPKHFLGGIESTVVFLLVSEEAATVSLVDYDRRESEVDQHVVSAVTARLKSQLGADIEFIRRPVSYSCVLGP